MSHDYGTAITTAQPLSCAPRLKNRLATSVQQHILDCFGWVSERGDYDHLFARAARRLVGAHLYSLKLEVNTACTLHCRMCYIRQRHAQLSMAAIERVFAQLRGCGVRIEILGGEPLLRPDIVQIVGGAKQRARSPFVSLYTNGLGADRALCGKLRQAGLDAVLVTLVSHRREVHDRFCGAEGAWQRTLQGIRNLRDAGIEVYTFTAVHRDNYRECRAIRQFVTTQLGVHATFYQYVPQRRNDPLEIGREQWRRVKHWVVTKHHQEHMEFVRKFFLLTGNACSGGNFVLTVKADGSVQPCPFVTDLPLGNIHQQELWTIYRNRYAASRLREFKCVPAECQPCVYRSVCGGGCRAACGTLFGRYDRKDHRCPGPLVDAFDKHVLLERIPTFF